MYSARSALIPSTSIRDRQIDHRRCLWWRLEVVETAGPTPLGMPDPVDPDQDPLTIRVIGLPRFGEVRIDGKTIVLNTVVAADRFKTAVFKPDGKNIGPAGTLDILVEDGRGGNYTASLPITVRSSHHPPVLARPRSPCRSLSRYWGYLRR